MKCLFNLSKPFDFYPLYDLRAIELFELNGVSILNYNINEFSKKLKEDDFIIVENETKQFSGVGRDLIFLPELSFFERLFLISAFINSHFIDPKVVVISGNVIFENMTNVFRTIDNILSDEFLYSYPLIFFCAEKGNFTDFIEKANHESFSQFYFFKKFATLKDFESDKERFFGFSGFYYFHSIKLKEIFCSNEDTANIYFMAENAWKSGEEWEEIIENLNKINIMETIAKENPLIIKIDSNVKFYRRLYDFLDFFDTDENNNIIMGNVTIKNVKNSIVINKDDTRLLIINQSNCLVLAKNGCVRIENLY